MIPENIKVYAYNAETHKFINEFESTQRATVRLRLASGNNTYKIVDLVNNNGSNRKTFSKTLKFNIYLKTIKLI